MTPAQAIPNPAVAADQEASSPVLNRLKQITGSLAIGAIGGYVFYWITRGIIKLGLIEAGTGSLSPIPYILSGIISAAVVETAKLVHDGAMLVLGDKANYVDTTPSKEESTLDQFRRHSWKVVTKAERIKDDADVVFSNLFGVRTAKDIRDLTHAKIEELTEEYKASQWNRTPPDEKKQAELNEKAIRDVLYYGSNTTLSRFLEISRYAFWKQLEETISSAVPQELGIYAVEALGYSIIGGHAVVWLHAIGIINGLLLKVQNVYQSVDDDVRKERKRAEKDEEISEWAVDAQIKADCDILCAMYPIETEELTESDVKTEETGIGKDEKILEDDKEPALKKKLELADELQLTSDTIAKTQSHDLDQYPDLLDIQYPFVLKSQKKTDDLETDDENDDVAEVDDMPAGVALCEVEG